jgi:hypothetical protein
MLLVTFDLTYEKAKLLKSPFEFNVVAIRQLAEADHFLKYCIKHGFKDN